MKINYSSTTWDEKEKRNVMDVFDLNWFSNGYYTQEFEEKLAKWWGVKYALSINSGSSANFIAMQALNLPKESEVITAALAFPTTVSPILYHGLIPVFVDCDFPSYTINLDEVKKAITPKTKAIFFAHTLGNVCDMDRLMEIVEKNNLKLIEDCCDAVSSKWKGQKVGTFGDLATVSFYPAHHITTFGEGGAILTNNFSLYRMCQSIRDWGRACYCKYTESAACGRRFALHPFDHKYFYTNLGMNLKMSEAQAAFGVVQIDRLDGFVEKRKANFKYLYEGLKSSNLTLPEFNKNADASWFGFPISIENRRQVVEYLEKEGIQTRTIFSGNITRHPAYKDKGRIVGNLENTERVFREAFFIGVHPKLTQQELDYMIEKLCKVSQ